MSCPVSLSPQLHPPRSCVFALVKTMFDEQQMSTLADKIQAALMLRYNKRTVG